MDDASIRQQVEAHVRAYYAKGWEHQDQTQPKKPWHSAEVRENMVATHLEKVLPYAKDVLAEEGVEVLDDKLYHRAAMRANKAEIEKSLAKFEAAAAKAKGPKGRFLEAFTSVIKSDMEDMSVLHNETQAPTEEDLKTVADRISSRMLGLAGEISAGRFLRADDSDEK
jgi:hypothetical protein